MPRTSKKASKLAPPPWYTSKGFVVSFVFLAVILLFCGVVAALPGGGNQRASAAPAQPAAHHRTVDTGGSVCGMPVGNTNPVVGPPDAHWALVGTIAAPTVPNVGPGTVEAHDRRCFAHSPAGAVVAAANLLPTTSPPYADAPKTLGHFLPGHTRDVYSKQPSAAVDQSVRVQLVAFRSSVISPDAVDVTVAYRTNQGGVIVSLAWRMRWFRGDWRAALGPVAEPFAVDGPVTLDETWIRWGGA